MEDPIERIERFLEESSRRLPAACRRAEVVLPVDLAGKEWLGFKPTADLDDEKTLKWGGRKWKILLGPEDTWTVHSQEARRAAGRTRISWDAWQWHVPSNPSTPAGDLAYRYAREGQQDIPAALLATTLGASLRAEELEVYFTLLRDGTPAFQASKLAAIVA